jgi:GGDEF domain-containing protein
MAKLSIFTGSTKHYSNEVKGPRHLSTSGRTETTTPFETESAASLLNEADFRRMLCRERKRSERSRKHLLLMLIDGKGSNDVKEEIAFLHEVAECLSESMRETDLAGWFEADSVFGVIFTELGQTDIKLAMNVIQTKVTTCLQRSFTA